jgi:hypothetical protein
VASTLPERTHARRDLEPPNSGRLDNFNSSHYGRAALANALDAIETAPAGISRHKTLYRVSAGLGNLIAGGELLDEEIVYHRLTAKGYEVLGPERAREVERTVRDGIDRGKTTPRKAPDKRKLQSAAEARGAAIEWWDRAQTINCHTCRRILGGGFFQAALGAGKLTLSETYRQLAERAGVSASTVCAHRKHWRAFVRRVSKANRWQKNSSSVWQLGVYPTGRNARALTNTPVGECLPHKRQCSLMHARSDAARDLWHRWSGGWSLYALLEGSDEPLRASEIAGLLGVNPSTARRGLRRLEANDMAERGPNGWHSLRPETDEGWYHRNQRKQRHRDERALFNEVRDEKLEGWKREREGGPGERGQPERTGETDGASARTGAPDGAPAPLPGVEVPRERVWMLSHAPSPGRPDSRHPPRPGDDGVAVPGMRRPLSTGLSMRGDPGSGGEPR